MTEFITFNSTDGIELKGILFKSLEKSSKTVIHVHGLYSNFYYENFVTNLANMYKRLGYNFLVFNNRGHDYAADLIKNNKKIMGGSVSELFDESIFDIEGAIEYVKPFTKEIILSAHSFGCNKIVNYVSSKEDTIIKRLILMAPTDIVFKHKQLMNSSYDTFLNQAIKLIEEGKKNSVMVNEYLFPKAYTAETFVSNYTDNSNNNIFRYSDPLYKSPILSKIKLPVLIEIGTKDKMVFIKEADDITSFFNNNLINKRIDFIDNADHHYRGHEEKLTSNIEEWLV